MQGMVVRHPVMLGLASPSCAEAEQAGGDDAELEEDYSCTCGNNYWPSGAHYFSINVISEDEN